MQKFFSRARVAFVLIGVGVAIGMFLSIGEKPNSAQERPADPPKAKFEQFSRADAVTAQMRDASKELVRVEFRSIDDREKASRYGTVVEEFGSAMVIVKDKKIDLTRSGLDVQKIPTTINLPGSKFEPVGAERAETVRPGESQPERGYYIVQLGGLANDDWLDSIRDAGVEILQYVPHQAFFVYGDGDAIAKVASHSRVRWVGRYLPEQKISAHASEFTRSTEGETALFDVAVFARASFEEVAAGIGGRMISQSKLPNNFFNVYRAELSKGDLNRIAQMPDVLRIDPYVKPTAEDERAAQIVAGNFSSTTVLNGPGYNPLTEFGADGTNVTVGMVDDGVSIPGNGGFYLTSTNTVDGPLRGATAGASGGHGHLNASIIAGSTPFGILDPTGYNYGLGIAPKANIINIPFLKSGNTTTDVQAVDDTFSTLGPNGVRGSITNNSWGAGTNSNAYDSLAAQYDGFVRDGSIAPAIDPFTIIFSAGNSGPTANSLTRPKVSKNTIAVANSENIRTELGGTNADNMDDLRSSSSRGPAADGRVKPDITAPGSYITGSRAGTCGSVSSCFDPNHAYSIGTSHAAPQVAGAAALFTQYWRDSHAGAYPSPSLIKAAILNTGQEMNGLTTNASAIPNGNEGWGRMNMKSMMSSVPTLRINESYEFSNTGTAIGYIGTVADSTKPVRVTLVWTDPPGVSDPALVNNLDLQVNVNGTFYRGNVLSGGTSTTGGTGDTVNNVEMVLLPAGIPAGSFFSVGISAVTLNGDGVLGNADTTDQHFSVVAYNFQALQPNLRPVFDFDGDDKTDISIFRPSNSQWWINRSSDSSTWAGTFGAVTEPGTPVPADFTGDGKTDIAVWRPNDGMWFVLRSENFTFYAFPFGFSADTPVVGYFNNDSLADVAVWRSVSSFWFVQYTGGGSDIFQFGTDGDRPVIGDYDGDGISDVGIFRPSNGQWWLRRSTGGVIAYQFGTAADKTVPGDYTGDGKTDVAFWRPSTGEWFILRSENLSYYSVPFGANGDLPVPGDYDGDGRFDTAVFRPAGATWYVNRSTAGTLITNWGASTDTPVPNVFVK